MTSKQAPKPVTLIIMDGWGEAPAAPDNAAKVARTPVLDGLLASFSHTSLKAHGPAVGLPEGQMGNSEVGHLNLGAGRVVKQDLVIIDEAIEDGSFAKNEVFLNAARKITTAAGRAHIVGLCSPGGVHSSLRHLYALVDMLASRGIEVWLHAITDGRDTPPRSAREYLADIEMNIAGKARVAVVVGRYYSMDRDNRWDRVEKGYLAHVAGEGTPHRTVDDAIAAAYEAGENDEFITPRIIVDKDGEPRGLIGDNDGVFFFNFRADRAREMTIAFNDDAFDGFSRTVRPGLSAYVCMTEYSHEFGLPIAFAPMSLDRILGEVLSNHGLKQFRSAETEKYAHVTFFFNGGVEEPFDAENRKLVASPKEVATYDLKPEMSAQEVADVVVDRVKSGEYDFVLVNFANGDMVGHTGILEAAVAAAETVDTQVGRIVDTVTSAGGAVIITADHGNLEQMRDNETGEPHTAHTNNPVPFILVDKTRQEVSLRDGGSLCDVAPTILALFGVPAPPEMTGKSLIALG
ncbi:MAG: 2,3-bisphosphoglycerate-independent phosphoglycerate mutase [Deltaproteobacteria bacterium]|nr:2,3-bisphosphoglycerate-independent phosphoglycerate mutase [Deltaproteobacteria bacterium]